MENLIGLILAGGGAKGAYQVGALNYLSEIEFEPKIIAGTSMGALNGAVLASNSSFVSGVNALNILWKELAEAEIIKLNTAEIVSRLSFGSQKTIYKWLTGCLQGMGFFPDNRSIFDPEPIEYFIKKTVNLEVLRQGLELWITVFPSLNIPGVNYDLLMAGIDIIRAKTGTKVHWLRDRDLDDNESLYNLLLASAAIPLLFPQREVNGQFYVDAGLVGRVPFEALAARGCTHAIVIHLDNGKIWNRHDFPEQTIIEIRPEKIINHSDIPIWGSITTALDFSPQYITELKLRGYEDAKRCLKPILQSFEIISEQRQSYESMVSLTHELLNDDPL